MKHLLTLLAFLYIQVSISQGKVSQFYLLDENPIINSDEVGTLHYIISIKSKDSTFKYDSYKFIIPNKIGFDKYDNLNNMEKSIVIDNLEYTNICNLKDFTPCELHNLLSSKKNINLIYKKKSYQSVNYVKVPLIYNGTQKDIEMLKLN